jgi:hypothetical protein
MKKITIGSFLLAGVWLCATTTLAQPIITSGISFPAIGSVDSVLGGPASVPPGGGGAGVTWNLSGLTLMYGGTLSIVNPSGTPYTGTFPTSNFCLQLVTGTTSYDYNRKSAIGIENLATTYAGVGTGTDYSPNPRLNMPFPFHYLDAVTDTFQSTTSAPETVILTYDGYGTLITPFHTYTNVIRVKEDYGGTDYDYVWYTVSPFMMVMNYNNSGNNYVCVSATPVTSGIKNTPETVNVSISPNPLTSYGILKIDAPVALKNTTIHVTDMIGRTVKAIAVYGSETIIKKDDLAPGIYLYHLLNEGKLISIGKLEIQ